MNILHSIIERKRIELQTMQRPDTFERTERNFVQSLRRNVPGLIAEIKPRSPSAGDIINRSSVPQFVEVYSRHAQAVSVLCDTVDFGGGYDLLSEVRQQTDLPILAKEFIIDAVQVEIARAAGADAVLLIAAVLEADEIQTLAERATLLGMGVLLELHDKQELQKIPQLPPESLLLGINNRNLDTLEIDLATTEQLAPLLQKQYSDYYIVSESGIEIREDIERLSATADGFLIGTTFLKAEDPDEKMCELFDREKTASQDALSPRERVGERGKLIMIAYNENPPH